MTQRPSMADGLSGAAIRRRLQERFSEPAALRAAMRQPEGARIRADLPGEAFGLAEHGRDFLMGRVALAGVVAARAPDKLFAAPAPSDAWAAGAHAFAWAGDLAALGGARARAGAQSALAAWLAVGDRYDPLVWRGDVAARRLNAWLRHPALFAPDAETPAALAQAYVRSAAGHADWLSRRCDAFPAGAAAVIAAVAVAQARIAISGGAAGWDDAAALLERTLARAVSPDGGCPTRAPADAYVVFETLTMLLEQCRAAGVAAPDAVRDAARRAGGALRFFRATDGGLPLFNGAAALADGRVDAALAAVKLPVEPRRSLPETGFHRMTGGRVAVIIDAGPASREAAGSAHAGALSIELTSARRRLIVNVGSAAHLSDGWAAATRSAEAHSTTTLDDAPFVARERRLDPFSGRWEAALSGPNRTGSERKEERNGVWVLCSHDGYAASHGVAVTRRLFLSADGGDFRGEDSVALVDGGRRTFDRAVARAGQRAARAEGGGRGGRDPGLAFTSRFHLHPDVAAAIVADGEAVTLRLPHGEVWVMRQAGGAIALEPSVYLGGGGRPVDTQQIVLSGVTRRDSAQIRWAFRRVGDLAQLPKDLDALAATPLAEDALDERELQDMEKAK